MDTNLYKYNNVPSGLPVVPKKSNTKKYVLVLLVLIVAGVAVFAFIKKDWLISLAKKEEPTVNLPPAPKYTKTDLPTDKLPEIFPKDLIQEKNPMILESYQAEIGSGKKQYSVKYISEGDPKDIFVKYFTYFTKNKWALGPDGSVSQNNSSSFITAVQPKEGKAIYINSSVNKSTGGNIVDIMLILYTKNEK